MSSPPPPSIPPPDVVKNRWLGFLIWQTIAAAAAVHLPSSVLLFPLRRRPSAAAFIFSFLSFHLALLLLSLALFLLISPHPRPSASLSALAAYLLKSALRTLGFSRPSATVDSSLRARRTLSYCAFLMLCGIGGFISAVALCGEMDDGMRLVGVGFRGLTLGLIYGIHYLYRKRWLLTFPIIQRPLFYSFKMGLSSAFARALKMSFQAYVFSTILMLFMPHQINFKYAFGRLIFWHIKNFIGTVVISFCWEISHHLLQVIQTRRSLFALTQGSAAAETNPSEVLLEALEESPPRSLIQYLAYLDLCMVSESNVEPWRRAAFFEETGETYKRIVDECLKPLEQLALTIAEGLEGSSMDKSDYVTKQLILPVDVQLQLRLYEAFSDFQICAWCSRTLAALTSRSRLEDRYGVAQLSGSNKLVVSILLSCLLAFEAALGKKTSLQPTHFMGPANIRWGTANTAKGTGVNSFTNKRKDSALHSKAYAMADVFRTSIYHIISAFLADMQASAKASVLEKNWIADGKPLYGSREILVQKLSLFLEYRAV